MAQDKLGKEKLYDVVKSVNADLKTRGSDYRIKFGSRNDYCAVDYLTVSDRYTKSVDYVDGEKLFYGGNLMTGKIKECFLYILGVSKGMSFIQRREND